MGKGYIILGEITDYLTGETVTETHDEQARQRIARYLVEEKGYKKTEIASRIPLTVEVDGQSGNTRIDFMIRIHDTAYAIIMYGPGSLVSRQKPALAAALLIEPYRIPLAVVTNGIDAHVMETQKGKVTGKGFAAIPDRETAVKEIQAMEKSPVSKDRREKARRILYVMDILTAKECDGSCELC